MWQRRDVQRERQVRAMSAILYIGEQHELGPEQEDGYQHAASDAHEVARGKREHASMGIRHTAEAMARAKVHL